MEEDVRSDLLHVVALSVLGVLGLATNSFIFVLFYNRRSVRTFSNRFVLSLASSHILQCIVIIPAFLASAHTRGDLLARATSSLALCLNLASVLSILLIAVDRNCAVNSPLHYNLTVTKKRAGLLICGIWGLAAALAAPTLFGMPLLEPPEVVVAPPCGLASTAARWSVLRTAGLAYMAVVGTLGFAVPFLSVACLYFAMFRAAETNNARARRNSGGNGELVVSLKPARKPGAGEYSLRRNFSSERPTSSFCCCAGKHKAAVTGLLVVLSFVVCWLPYFAALLVRQFRPLDARLASCVHLATFLACVLNPYVYFFRNKNTWRQSKKLLSRLLKVGSRELHHSLPAKKRKTDTTVGVFRLPISLSQTVLSTQEPVVCTLSSISVAGDGTGKHAILTHQVQSRTRRPTDPAKPLLHQDSSSSNDSSDVGVTTVMIGSTLSVDEEAAWCRAYHQRYSEDTMVDIPLCDIASI